MSLEHWFRLLQYLTLGLSCAALVFAEEPFLPDLQICLAPVLALLFLAWWVDGRWALPNWGANILGLLIAAGGITWLVGQLSDDDFVLANLPLHLALLPYMGPLSMAALLVKVFRTRDAGHFWHLQGLGLMQIGLGCVLDGGPDFGAAAMIYLAGTLACLALHYRLSSGRAANGVWHTGSVSCRVERTPHPAADAAGVPHATRTPHPAADAAGAPHATQRWLLSFTLTWALLISLSSLLLFLLTPRRDNASWQPLNRIRSGYSRGRSQDDNEEMNLNHIGRVDLDDEPALQIVATNAAGQPKLDLPDDQRWRGSVLDWYDRGKWTTMHLTAAGSHRGQQDLPDFGPGKFLLDFTIQPRQSGGLVLAEPIRFGPPFARLPVIPAPGESRRRMFAELSGTVLPQVFTDWRREYHYRQVVPVQSDPSRITAEIVWPEKEISTLTDLPPALRTPLRNLSVELLQRLSQRPNWNLPKTVRAALAKSDSAFRVERADWETVAQVLTSYLALSGEYTYSLEQTRYNRSLDPVLDFLINVKKGHCERYAAALALVLRSIGIPARVVKGFRGCDNLGEGKYVVRHSHAHAWVEILVPNKRGSGSRVQGRERRDLLSTFWPRAPAPSSYDWLTLDATPPGSTATGYNASLTHLWDGAHRFCMQWWRALIVEYNGDEQADLWETLKSGRPLFVVSEKVGLFASVFVAAWAAWMVLRHRRQRRSSSTVDGDGALYSRLVRILGRYVSLRPACGQTPREYGIEAHALLQTRPALATLAELPRRVIELFYRVRFGGRSLEEAERQQMDTELNRFAEALHKGSATDSRSPASGG